MYRIKENVAKRYGPSIVIRASKKWLRVCWSHRYLGDLELGGNLLTMIVNPSNIDLTGLRARKEQDGRRLG